MPQVGQLGTGLVTPPGSPWTVELLLGEVVSDVWQIPDSVQPIWATGSPGHLKQLGAA